MPMSRPAPILIVDDHPSNILALEAVLQPLGQPLVKAASGSEALKHLLNQDFALIILDVMMPEIDGFQTAELIRQRERTRHIPLLFLTAIQREEAQISRGYAQGAVDYILKPIEPEILRQKVQVYLDLYRKRADLREQEAIRKRIESERDHLSIREQVARGEADTRRGQLEAVFSSAPFPLALLNGAALTFELVNPVFGTLFSNRALIGQPLRQAIPEWEEAGLLKMATQAYRDGQTSQTTELPLGTFSMAAAGSRFFNFSIQPMREAAGSTTGVLICGFEVTDQVLAREQVEEAVRVRDTFLSVAGHELKTPLTSLRLHVETLIRESARSETTPKKLLSMLRQAERLTNLIQNLLDVSRIAGGRLTLEPEEVDLAMVIHEVTDHYRNELVKAGSALQLAVSGPLLAVVDRIRFDQIVTNLLSNAIKYGEGSPIELSLQRADGRARLKVRDFGIGIAPEHQMRIFERVERAVPSRHYGGLGLGLWIARQLVEAHGGSITVESAEGKGSTFTVDLPLRPDDSGRKYSKPSQVGGPTPSLTTH